ncbi:lysophospholipase L1-like esterase [Pedobacter cryoconitis]|uniref:rhamnogalacturonan acetylesterase n=1 Tax=Pedobacter cryoconitis TaxID=188932 RepID=UPI00161DE8EF|nr:rhamnogalacturonan acetylesterase [Pedobacter cryoconitis]MBB6270772.1 lysophospholipase L1-like esterase [Pedobacter cryoconitis]
MKRSLRPLIYILLAGHAALLLSFCWPAKNITVYLAGDSTMSDKNLRANPETGWGMPFALFFDSTVTVKNIAKNGRSTKTFLNEGLWKQISTQLKADDYVFIQFGHNDESPAKASYTSEADYKDILRLFVKETKEKNAIPVLITPVSRRKFNKEGKIEETHLVYSEAVRSIAREQKVILIDLDKESQALFQELGPENSKLLFNQLKADENPNYPLGKTDNTHFNELGARKIAEIVLREIRKQHLSLASRIYSKPVI